MGTIETTFFAALHSVGTAATLAGAGMYLDRKKLVTAEGKRSLAFISQGVTIPALFFTKLVYCDQNGSSTEPCPNVINSGNLRNGTWVLLIWPIYVVTCGLIVGEIGARLASTPPWQKKSVLASCAFGNSTGLPITLLAAIHANFPPSTELGRMDPTLFLSVYLLLYPVLQWGIGGWLLAPESEEEDSNSNSTMDNATALPVQDTSITRSSGIHHVLNCPAAAADDEAAQKRQAAFSLVKDLSLVDLRPGMQIKELDEELDLDDRPPPCETDMLQKPSNQVVLDLSFSEQATNTDIAPTTLTRTMVKVFSKAMRPPVTAALLGIVVSLIPSLRGLFVDMDDRDDDALFEWFFDGLYTIGQAAVPINMFILGMNLSMTMRAKTSTRDLMMSTKTTAAIVIGKMLVMPIIGVVSVMLLRGFFLDIPDDIDSSFYLVLMMVFITPTANNVMVMVELSGSGNKEGMAKVIGWQYAVAPVILSITVMIVVQVASAQ